MRFQRPWIIVSTLIVVLALLAGVHLFYLRPSPIIALVLGESVFAEDLREPGSRGLAMEIEERLIARLTERFRITRVQDNEIIEFLRAISPESISSSSISQQQQELASSWPETVSKQKIATYFCR